MGSTQRGCCDGGREYPEGKQLIVDLFEDRTVGDPNRVVAHFGSDPCEVLLKDILSLQPGRGLTVGIIDIAIKLCEIRDRQMCEAFDSYNKSKRFFKRRNIAYFPPRQ